MNPEEPSEFVFVPQSRAMTVGFRSLDEVNMDDIFELRALVMKTIPKFMRAVFRGAMKVSMEAIVRGRETNDVVAETRGWKLFLLLPRLLLSRPARGGLIPRGRLQERVSRFSAGEWSSLLEMALESSMQGVTASCRRRRGVVNSVSRRAVQALEKHLWEQTGISIHFGKTKLWNAGGHKPPIADALSAAAQVVKPEAVVWRGDTSLPGTKQGLKVLGLPVGCLEYIVAELNQKTRDQATLFDRIPHVPDVQSGWLLLIFCAATRANYWLRTIPPEFTEQYARRHDQGVIRCLSQILHTDGILPNIWESASMLLALGGLGVGGSTRVRNAAYWGSWADCLEMVFVRHPQIAEHIVGGMYQRIPGCLRSAQLSADKLRQVGVATPSWEALAAGLRPEQLVVELDPSQPQAGWQKFASLMVQVFHREHTVWPHLSPTEQAMVRSQSGPLASVPFTATPTIRNTRIDSEPFRVLLLRRLR